MQLGSTYFFPVGVWDGPTPLNGVPVAIAKMWNYIQANFPQAHCAAESEWADGVWDRARVRRVLEVQLPELAPDDTAIVYWAGHGESVGSHRLLLSEGDGLLSLELAGWLLSCPARRVVCMLDCCFAGDAARDLGAEADLRQGQEALPANERKFCTVISSARSEPSLEGAFVDAILDALDHGPHRDTPDGLKWDDRADRITPDQLAAAASEAIPTHKAGVRELRTLSSGSFFPSPWHRRRHPQANAVVPMAARTRQRVVAVFAAHNLPAPSDWTAAGLSGTLSDLPQGLVLEARHAVTDLVHAVINALSLQQLLPGVVRETDVTRTALQRARRAALRVRDEIWFDDPFDLFVDVMEPRVQRLDPRYVQLVFAARLAHEVGKGDQARMRLQAWGLARGLSGAVVNEQIEASQQQVEAARLVVNLCDESVAVDEFPRTALAQCFADQKAIGEPYRRVIAPADLSGVEAAIRSLIDEMPITFDIVDVIVPDLLLLVDPAQWPVQRNRRRLDQLGRASRVFIHLGGRLGDKQPQRYCDFFERALSEQIDPTYVEAWDQELELPDPRTVVFLVAPGVGGPPETLLDAAYDSPIVLWPATDIADRKRLEDVLGGSWPELPRAILEARFHQAPPAHADLVNLRLLWDDPSWIALARGNGYGKAALPI